MTRFTVPLTGRVQWWNAWDGSIRDAAFGPDGYSLALGRRESIILCIDPAEASVAVPVPTETQPILVRPEKWLLTRADGVTAELRPGADGKFPGWETLPGWEKYSGFATYEAAVGLAPGTVIDLGEVHEIARVYADGKHVGTRLWGPYRFRLPEGAQNLRVEVANTPAGKMDGVSLPSGMIG